MDIQAELISIGSELLNGRTLNIHAHSLGRTLACIGLRLSRDTTIPDDIPVITEAVAEAFKRVGLLFVSGGLGLTVDDVTCGALASMLGRKTFLHRPTIERLKRNYEKRGRPFTSIAARQARTLEKAVVLGNPIGTAPGQQIETDEGKLLFLLPVTA